jgi:hypothetical protein
MKKFYNKVFRPVQDQWIARKVQEDVTSTESLHQYIFQFSGMVFPDIFEQCLDDERD